MRPGLLMLLMLLAAPLAAAQADPNARDDLTLDHPVNDVVLSRDGQRLGVALQDESGSSLVDTPQGQDTWILYDIQQANFNTGQEGDADPDPCNEPLPGGPDCNTPARLVALSDDGQRMVVGARESGSRTQVVFVERQAGPAGQEAVAGAPTAIALDGEGKRGFTAVDISEPGSSGGRVHGWFWSQGGTISEDWSTETDEPVTALAVSRDGAVVAAAAGTHHVRFLSDGTPRLDNVPGSATAVAVANDDDHISIVGTSDGDFRIYSDDAPGGTAGRELNIPGSQPINSVAIDDAGRTVALGRADGTLSVWTLRHDPVLIDALVFQEDLGTSIDDVLLSADGSVLAVRIGAVVSQWSVTDDVDPLWNDTLDDAAASLSMDAGGERLAVAFSDKVRLYEAHHELSVDVPHPGDLTPDQDHTVTVALENLGNRREDVHLTVEGDASLDLDLSASDLSLLPGQSVEVDLTIGVGSTHPPGEVAVHLNATLASGTTVERIIEATVPEHEAWDLRVNGAPTSLPVAAGKSVSFNLIIANEGNIPGQPPVSTRTVGQGWSSEILAGLEEMGPGEVADLVVSLKAPADAAELAQGKVLVELPDEPHIELVATVGATFGVELDAPTRVQILPGNSTSITVVLRNTGNAPDSYDVRIGTVPAGWSALLANGFTELTARDIDNGASRTLTLQVQAPAGASGPAVAVDISAESLADDDMTASRTVLMEIQEPSETTTTTTDKGKDGPALPWVLALAAVAVVAWRRR